MILLLGGTTEGRLLADYLGDNGYKITVSTATAFPGWLGSDNVNVKMTVGRLDHDRLAGYVRGHGVCAVIDATHPFAVKISKSARSVCLESGLPYLRFERAESVIPEQAGIIVARTAAEAAALAAGKRVFLTTGVKSLKEFVRRARGTEFFARVLPWPESVDEALKWLPADRIIAALGPFSKDFNQACFRFFKAEAMVTKDSGAGGGVEDKISAALEMEMTVIMIKRPPRYAEAIGDFAGIVAGLREALDGAV